MGCIHVMYASYGYINDTSNAYSVDKFSSFANKGSKGVDWFFGILMLSYGSCLLVFESAC
jgi:hypothetical protein